MTEDHFYDLILMASFPLAAVTFLVLLFVSAPYGRHKRRGWGASISNRLGWLIMESPSPLIFAFQFFIGEVPKTLPMLIFFAMWEAHYIQRAFIYPFMIADGRKIMPLTIMFVAILFNSGNAYINGRYIFHISGASGGYPEKWVFSPAMIVGTILFLGGFVINRWSDRALQDLRAPGESGYEIPHGGLFRWISCPNYFGEIIEWIGWAIATWSLPGLAFAVWTIANLAPRARAHHTWYHEFFPEYPVERKALIPGVW